MLADIFESSVFALILLGIFLVCSIVLSIHYFRFLKIRSTRERVDASDQSPISIVIATRNEHDQLRQNLPFFMEQNYANLEVVVVIDDSDQGVNYIMQEFEKQYANLKVVSFDWSRNFFVDQKFAESVGIKSATHERILLSNICTRPASPEWVARMSNALSGDKKIVIGYHAMMPKSTFANAFVRFDRFVYVLRYMRAAISGNPFTADRKNVAFDRSLFYDAKGVAQFYNVNTGDEDMFVNRASTASNTTIEIHPNAFVKGQIEPSFHDWFEKKIRHRLLFKEFKAKNKLGLIVYDLFTALFYLFLIGILVCFFLPNPHISITLSDFVLFGGGVFVLKNLVQMLVFRKLMHTFQEHGLLLLMPFFDLLLLVSYPALLFTELFTKRITWK